MLEPSVDQPQTIELDEAVVFDGLLENGRLVYRPKIWQAIQRLKTAGVNREEVFGLIQPKLYPTPELAQDTQRDIDEAFAPPKPPEPPPPRPIVSLETNAPATEPTADLADVIEETNKQSPKRKPRRILTPEEIAAKAERKEHKLEAQVEGLVLIQFNGQFRRYPGFPSMLIHESKFAMLEHPASRRRPVHYTLVPKTMFKKKWFWRVWKHRKRLDIPVRRAMIECGFAKGRDE